MVYVDLDALKKLEAACKPGAHTDTALKAFYGARDLPRAQEVFTPASLLAPLIAVWGGIALDPCAHIDSPVPAAAKWFGEPSVWKEKDGKRVPVEWTGRGLTDPWIDGTYANPPFAKLEDWCAKARGEAVHWALLGPARTQRKWLRATMRGRTTVALNTVVFDGFEQGFPQGLLLIVNGLSGPAVGAAYEAAGLGEVLC